MEDLSKMTNEEAAKYIEDILNEAVENDIQLLKESGNLKEETNSIREYL